MAVVLYCRQEAFTSKNKLGVSVLDTLGMGIGFTGLLTVLGAVRELFGSGTVFGMVLMPASFRPFVIMVLPAGAFITLGILAAAYNIINSGKGEA